MDFSAWSLSHTILVAITLLALGAQLIAILVSLKINTKRLEDSVDKIDTKIDVVQFDIRKEIRDVWTEMNQQIGSVREELSKLNQNHIEHLTRHDSWNDKSRKVSAGPHASIAEKLQEMGIWWKENYEHVFIFRLRFKYVWEKIKSWEQSTFSNGDRNWDPQ